MLKHKVTSSNVSLRPTNSPKPKKGPSSPRPGEAAGPSLCQLHRSLHQLIERQRNKTTASLPVHYCPGYYLAFGGSWLCAARVNTTSWFQKWIVNELSDYCFSHWTPGPESSSWVSRTNKGRVGPDSSGFGPTEASQLWQQVLSLREASSGHQEANWLKPLTDHHYRFIFCPSA